MTSANDIETQAMEWLVRLDALEGADTAMAETARAQFNTWCASDARRQAAYVRLTAAWRKADQLKRLSPLDGEVDIDLLASPKARRSRLSFGGPKALAAAAAFVALGAMLWFVADNLMGQTYITRLGGFERLLLADGSIVELDTDSKVRVRLTAQRRHLTLLRGQAHFKVAPDMRRPFEVDVAETTVRAIGTAFSIRMREHEQIEVLVTEGRVAIATPEPAADSIPTLSAGEAVIIKPSRLSVQPMKMESAGIARQLSWTQGRLTFDGETLGQAIVEFNRYNPRRLTLADPSIASVRIGGSFQPTDPQSFIAALERSFGVRVQSSDEKEIRLIRAQ